MKTNEETKLEQLSPEMQKALGIVVAGGEIKKEYETTTTTCKCMAQVMNKNRRNGKFCKHILAMRIMALDASNNPLPGNSQEDLDRDGDGEVASVSETEEQDYEDGPVPSGCNTFKDEEAMEDEISQSDDESDEDLETELDSLENQLLSFIQDEVGGMPVGNALDDPRDVEAMVKITSSSNDIPDSILLDPPIQYLDKDHLYLRNDEQRVLYLEELRGQISDGYWENAGGNYQEWMLGPDEVVVDPHIQGRTFWAMKCNYNFTAPDLLDVVADRMIFYVCLLHQSARAVKIILANRVSLPDSPVDYAMHVNGEYHGDWVDRITKVWAEAGLTNEIVLAAAADKSYTMENLRKDLNEIKRAARHQILID